MNKVYHHLNKNSNLEKLYLISIIPLVLYAIYKNGFLLYQKDLIHFIVIFKPIIYIIIPFIISIMINYYKTKKINLNHHNLRWVFISLFIPLSTNIAIYIVLILIFMLIEEFLSRKINLNYSIIFKLFLVIILMLINQYSYLSLLEQNYDFAYNFLDFIFGRTIGGLASTSLIFAIITYIILTTNTYYKKNIPLISILTYIIGIAILSIFNSIYLSFTNIAGIFLAYVLIGTDFKFSPYNYKGQIIYAIFLGVLTIIFSLIFNVFEGVFIALIIMHFGSKYIDLFLSRPKMTK